MQHNADAVEVYIADHILNKGQKPFIGIKDIIMRVRQERRPHCIVCHEPIHNGNPGAMFCSKIDCKRVKRRYVKMRKKGMHHAEALGEILDQVA